MANWTCLLLPEPATSPSEERRQFERYRIYQGKNPHLVAHLDSERWPAHVIDLSKGGVSVLFGRRLEPGVVVGVSLHHITRRFACQILVQIAFAAECEGAFLLGAAFTRELTDEEMAGLL